MGSGGLGKSALCEQYARWFAEDHPGGVFLIRLGGSDRRTRGEPQAVMTQFHVQLREIAKRLGGRGKLIGFDRDPEAMEAAKVRLDELRTELGEEMPAVMLASLAASGRARGSPSAIARRRGCSRAASWAAPSASASGTSTTRSYI